MSQPPRKAPSQPNGVKPPTQGTAKKARPSRSNSHSRPNSVAGSDCYAMGSYDNDPTVEPTSTPSWMRSTSNEANGSQFPSSPSFPASPTPVGANSNGNVIAPIPFHLGQYQTVAPSTMIPNFGGNMNSASLGMAPPLMPLNPSATVPGGMLGVNPTSPAFPGAFMGTPSASAPPTQPLHTQDAIARILALQQQTASMSASTTPLDFAHPANQNTVNFSRNFAEDPRTCLPHQQPAMTTSLSFPGATPVVSNPFAAPMPSMVAPKVDHNAPTGTMSPFAVPSAAAPIPHSNGTSVSLDHLLSMQQQANQTRSALEQLKLSQAASRASPSNGDSVWQLQQPIHSNGGKPTQLSVSSDGSLKMGNGHSQSSAADFLFEPTPANRMPLKTSGKHIPSPRSAPIHAHHNYGVPAQP